MSFLDFWLDIFLTLICMIIEYQSVTAVIYAYTMPGADGFL